MKDTPVRVLIVEDIPSDAELAERTLTMHGFNIVSTKAETKEEFIRSLREFKPDVILCDYMLPSFNGMEALNLSLQHDPLLPFIIVTGSINESMAVECMKAGSTDYLLKEHLAKLPFAVKEALEKKEALSEKIKAELELRESEERYRSLFQNNYAAMLFVDPKTAAIVDANYSACKYYGWSVKEMVAQRITDITVLPPYEIYAKMDLAQKEVQNSFLFKHRLANGDVKDVGVAMGPLSLKNRPLLYLVIHEITERRASGAGDMDLQNMNKDDLVREVEGLRKQILKLEESTVQKDDLIQKHSLLANIVESSDDAIIGSTVTGTIVTWNKGAEKIFGYTEV